MLGHAFVHSNYDQMNLKEEIPIIRRTVHAQPGGQNNLIADNYNCLCCKCYLIAFSVTCQQYPSH